MTLTSEQETAVHVVRVLLRKSPADAARVVDKMTDAELAEVIQMAAHLHALQEQLRQMLA